VENAGEHSCNPVSELERQVERGSMFTQAVFQKSFTRLSLVEAVVREMLDLLVERGVVAGGELADAMNALDETADGSLDDKDERSKLPWPAVAVRVDPSEPTNPEPVDCSARLPVCHAVCCRLKFALSQDEIEGGQVKWDIGHPYVIRQDSTGYCSHNDCASRSCTVYDDRPRVCREYSCRGDGRIWKDFDAMVLNTEWVTAHLSGRDAILLVDAEVPPGAVAAQAPSSVPGREVDQP
jgi:Fe-S-cluster containining protein